MGKKHPRLTLDEHREVAGILARIRWRIENPNANVPNKFALHRETITRLKRAAKDIDKLRSKLEGLLLEQLPDVAEPLIYSPRQVDPLPWDRISHEMFAVGRVINGAVPAPVIDLYLRCINVSMHRALLRLDEVLNDGSGELLRGFDPYSHEHDCNYYYSSDGNSPCTCGAKERHHLDGVAQQARWDRRKGVVRVQGES
jgi:hypothetical protein